MDYTRHVDGYANYSLILNTTALLTREDGRNILTRKSNMDTTVRHPRKSSLGVATGKNSLGSINILRKAAKMISLAGSGPWEVSQTSQADWAG